MGFMDDAKKLAEGARDKVDELVDEHGDQVRSGIDKVADLANEKTGGKHGDKIERVVGKAKGALDKRGKGPA